MTNTPVGTTTGSVVVTDVERTRDAVYFNAWQRLPGGAARLLGWRMAPPETPVEQLPAVALDDCVAAA